MAITINTCVRCNHQWAQRGARSPKSCPKCGGDWTKPRMFERHDLRTRGLYEKPTQPSGADISIPHPNAVNDSSND